MSIIKGKTNVVAGFGGTKRPLGEVYFSQSSLATDNPGALPGWTGDYYENGKTLFPDLYNFVKAQSTRYVTKTEYDSILATYGECPKYVVDEVDGSLRLPKYANYIKVANSTEGITQKGAGLPNVTGDFNAGGVWTRYASGAFNVPTAEVGGDGPAGNGSSQTRYTFDASRSSAIYGASDTVQPAHTTLYLWISAYTSAITASVAQAAEFTNALTGKANTDLSNVLANIDYVVDRKVPTASDPSWYEVWKSGKVRQGGSNQTAGAQGTQYTFLKPFASGSYTFIATPILVYDFTLVITEKTATTYKVAYSSSKTGYYDWIAEGQGGGSNT